MRRLVLVIDHFIRQLTGEYLPSWQSHLGSEGLGQNQAEPPGMQMHHIFSLEDDRRKQLQKQK
jgi:hypothetical protein